MKMGMERGMSKGGKDQLDLDFDVPFEEYNSEQRQALALAVRTKKEEDLTPEEKRYRNWMGEKESGDSQPDYSQHWGRRH